MSDDDLPANPTAAPLVIGMREMIRAINQVNDTLTRREERAPGEFHFWPGGFRVQPQLRVINICVAPLIAGNYGVKIGANVRYRFTASGGVVTVPAEVTINRGETISLIDLATGNEASAAQILDAWLFAYSDAPESKGVQA